MYDTLEDAAQKILLEIGRAKRAIELIEANLTSSKPDALNNLAKGNTISHQLQYVINETNYCSEIAHRVGL